jgi:CheY-like chemotaxis protein
MEAHAQPVVLMVDDDEDDCVLATDAFKQSKVSGSFYCVEDGIELFNYLFHSGKYAREVEAPLPALILLDLNMPRKDGRQALKEIKSIPAFQNIPIVVFTTSRDEKDRAYSREMGAEAFLTKPVIFKEWVRIMKSIAENWLN